MRNKDNNEEERKRDFIKLLEHIQDVEQEIKEFFNNSPSSKHEIGEKNKSDLFISYSEQFLPIIYSEEYIEDVKKQIMNPKDYLAKYVMF